MDVLQTDFYCNSRECRADHRSYKDIVGNRILDKFVDLLLLVTHDGDKEYENMHCIHCGNWICGKSAAFGTQEEQPEN